MGCPPSAAASDATRSFDAGEICVSGLVGPDPAAFLHSGSARSLVVSVAFALRWHPTLSCPAMGTLSRPVDWVEPVVVLAAAADLAERLPVEPEGQLNRGHHREAHG